MSDTTLQYFLEYTFTASDQCPLDGLVTGTVDALTQAMSNVENGKLLFLFKVLAEPKLIAVVQASDAAELDSALTKNPAPSIGQQVQVQCVPLRPYEAFAKEVLGVETSFQQTKEWAAGPGQFYWLTVDVEYMGMTQEELFGIWKQEAMAALGVMEQDGAKLWKVPTERKVIILAKMPTPDVLDNTFMAGLPMFNQMGNQTHIICKPVLPFKSSTT
ncbi:PREDICTED: uncharacterized protein LOC109467940 isoform X1 [Branchiostoma belcheri]|uniref:Uncharacterized protein LOC109467940 isoform X1 n=1 Tax=Branchiostoma belcheri TaxID=7741 RepID=A0A6P4YSQ4_BRABE|nr:PREDICTED: uncharacterized protein LOC109467940 isoform X1 [Branchiostoma belcheri]